jgi:CubicO group peptidase (beta-lactamase class C family)/D-alanyl-D-alanine dipeptidase
MNTSGSAATRPRTRFGVKVTLVALLGAVALPMAPAHIAAQSSAHGGVRATTITPDSTYADVASFLERVIDTEMRDKDLPAVSIALVDGDRIVWARGFGEADPVRHVPATAETVYRVGSVSKLFTDIGIMQLVEQRRVDLDAPVSRYIPDFHPTNPFGIPITLRQLTSHRSGLVREPPVGHYFDSTSPSLRATVVSLDSTTLIYPPGTHTKYSNAGVATAGYVLERLGHRSFPAYLADHVLAPLGMDESAFELTPSLRSRLATGYMWTYDGRRFAAPTFQFGESPAGSLYTTVTDLSRFMSAMFARGQGAHARLLRPETVEAMWVPQFAQPGSRTGYGIGFGVDTLGGHRKVGHGGAIYGFATQLTMLPDQRLGVAVVTTLDAANVFTTRVADAALRAMLAVREHQAIPVWVNTAPVQSTDAARLAGRYASDNSTLELTYIIAPSDTPATAAQLVVRSSLGGTRGVLRQRGDTLVRDDQLGFGARLLSRGDTLFSGGTRFIRLASNAPDPVTPRLDRLVGEYGWDHDILYILEDHGRLNALIEWFFQSPLTRTSDTVFTFPAGSLYDGEPVAFSIGRDGKVAGLHVGKVWFPRRAVGPASGNQLRVTPVRPIAELEREARAASPPVETGHSRKPDLVELVTLDSTIRLEVRYATTNNFLGTRFYSEARAFLERPAAEALVRAHRELKSMGYGILVHDAYRPWYVTKMFWDAVPQDKKIFVADPSQGSRHNRGAAADVSLYDVRTGAPVTMVGTYDETSDRSYANYPGGTSLQRWHRALLRHAMEAHGFTVYNAEWWHFDYKGWNEYPILNVPFNDIHQAAR